MNGVKNSKEILFIFELKPYFFFSQIHLFREKKKKIIYESPWWIFICTFVSVLFLLFCLFCTYNTLPSSFFCLFEENDVVFI